MADLNAIVAQATADGASGTLDLTDWRLSRFDHAELVAASTLGWWLLAGKSGIDEVRIPEAGQAVFHRGGLVAACRRRAISVQVVPTDGDGAHLFDSEALDSMLAPAAPDDFVVIPDLAHSINRPPEPDEHGRRYTWVRDLIPPSSKHLPGTKRALAGSDTARCLFEFVDNVHRWAMASEAIAVVSITRGGGEESFDRLHIVVMDDGRGIIASVLDDSAQQELPGGLSEDPRGLLLHFLKKAFGDRNVPRHNGHGLHMAQLLAKQWIGRVDVLSADAIGNDEVHRARSTVRGGIEGCESFVVPGARGTLAEITLNLTVQHSDWTQIVHDEEEEQQTLFPITTT